MTGAELLLVVVLIALIAWYAARDEHGPVNAELAALVFFALTTVLFFGLYEVDEIVHDETLTTSVQVAGQITTMAEQCQADARVLVRAVTGFGSRPDSIAAALRALLEQSPRQTERPDGG